MCSTSVDGSGRYVSAQFTVKLQEARSRCDCKAFCKIFFRWLVTYKYVTPCNQGYCQTAFIHMVPNHTSFYSLNFFGLVVYVYTYTCIYVYQAADL